MREDKWPIGTCRKHNYDYFEFVICFFHAPLVSFFHRSVLLIRTHTELIGQIHSDYRRNIGKTRTQTVNVFILSRDSNNIYLITSIPPTTNRPRKVNTTVLINRVRARDTACGKQYIRTERGTR